jgi:nucleotide-binding universal stress UspA family protein
LCSATDDPEGSRQWLHGVVDRHLPDSEVDIEVIESGDAIDAIVEAAGSTGLVCMATAATLRPHRGRVGSVAEGVVRRIGRPVALVGPAMEPEPGQRTQRVILPVDGSALSESSLGIAEDLALVLDVPLWIVMAVSHKTEAAAQAEVGDTLVSVESGYVARLARDIGQRIGRDVEYEVLHLDDPAKAIIDFAKDDGTVVMATHGRSGLNRLFGGSVATDVVAHSKRAVFVWRPEGA